MESLKEKTAKGLFWGGMNNGMQQLLGLVFGIILGRLLSPSDYGLIAMITIFSLIATALHLLTDCHSPAEQRVLDSTRQRKGAEGQRLQLGVLV